MASEPAESMATIGMFSGVRQFANFCRIQQLATVKRMAPSSRPFEFPTRPAIELPETYHHNGVEKKLNNLLTDTDTSALLVFKDGAVCFERYWLTGGRGVQWISMSVAKSFTSALVGIAHGEGRIERLDDSITRYATSLSGSAYDGVRIRDVLQMSSGARFVEDYTNPDSEIFRLAASLGPGGSFEAFMRTMRPEVPPGTRCLYASADTQALALLLISATGRSLTDYMQTKLCEPLGMESAAFWMSDSQGVEAAFVGLLMTARDFAKLGELYRNGGAWGDRQIVPADFVTASVRCDAPHLVPGRPIVSGHSFALGYGYQWWIPEGDRGEFSAVGVYNQYVYVDPSRGAVVVKLSANPRYGLSHDDADNKDVETIFALRAICRQLD